MSKCHIHTVISASRTHAKYSLGSIAICCVLGILLLFVICIGFLGTETVLKYAEQNDKPYAMLFLPHAEGDSEEDKSSKIICLGDSTFFYPPYEDDPFNGRPDDGIPMILEKTLRDNTPGFDVSVSSRAFRSANMYNYYCMFYEAEKHHPDLVVIPINWTTFGAWWKWLLKDNFPELCALAPLNDNLITEQDNLIRSEGISLLKQVEHKISIWSIYPHGVKHWAKSAVQSLFNYHPNENTELPDEMDRFEDWRQKNGIFELVTLYPMELGKSDEPYRHVRAVANLSSKHRVKVLFYITPINLDFIAQKGALDQEAFEASKELIIEATRADGVYCLDLSGLLRDEYFIDVTAHYNLEGRQKICDALASVVTEILKKD